MHTGPLILGFCAFFYLSQCGDRIENLEASVTIKCWWEVSGLSSLVAFVSSKMPGYSDVLISWFQAPKKTSFTAFKQKKYVGNFGGKVSLLNKI